MSVQVKGRQSKAVKARKPPGRSGERRGRHSRFAPPATQRENQRRPAGVRAPQLDNPVRIQRRTKAGGVPPVMVDTGRRLTDRGLAVAMAVAITLVVAAVVCITTTAARVTAEPAVGGIAAAAHAGVTERGRG